MTRIAVDAMGGDHAPESIVRGAVECGNTPACDFTIVLVGDESRIRPYLPSGGARNVELVHASEVIEMHESVTSSLKTKKDSSILKSLSLHRDGEVHAVISAGNTAAVMAASTLLLGRLDGVSRPTIGTFLPTEKGRTLLVDAGANVDCKPNHLVQFAIMGSIHSEHSLGIRRPTVGLLNIGEEEGKGNDVIKETHSMLKTAPVNFVGNIEGRDILKGSVDVAVCDGFVGNIVLKFAESFPGLLKKTFRAYADRGILQKLRMGVITGAMRSMFRDWDYQEYGGVPLLGLKGISLIGHGSSTPTAIQNMILQAKHMIDTRVNEHIAAVMRQQSVAS